MKETFMEWGGLMRLSKIFDTSKIKTQDETAPHGVE